MALNKQPISELIDGGGLVITKSSEELVDLSYHEVVSLFEKSGVIVFRGFDLDAQRLLAVTHIYTESYAGDAMRRAKHFGELRVRSVDMEFPDVELHSEASFAPAWPEVIWLFCNNPSVKDGNTILCDGVKLWKSLTSEAKNFFICNPILYQCAIPIAEKRPGKGKRSWFINTQGAGEGYIDWETGVLHIAQTRFAVQESRIANALSFANHLLITVDREPQLLSRTTLDGKEIPEEFTKEILEKAEKLTCEFSWQKNDLIMLDNKRFLHGRRPYAKDDPRDILITQTAKASFGYGATTRGRKRSPCVD